MRQIKFRAWDAERKEMCVKGLQFTYEEPHGVYGFYHADGREMEEYILMQFTGLLDKNGKEIYEGDVISFNNNRGTITWLNGGARFLVAWENKAFDNLSVGHAIKYEIIGNIHEGPKLLK